METKAAMHCRHCRTVVYGEYVDGGRFDILAEHRCPAMQDAHSYEHEGRRYFTGCDCRALAKGA